jgi:hypothetical protein
MSSNHSFFVVKAGPLRVVIATVFFVISASFSLFLIAASVTGSGTILARIVKLLIALTLLVALPLIGLSINGTRIEMGPERLRLRVLRSRGSIPLLAWARVTLPYVAVARVERRDEVYNLLGLIDLWRAYSIVTKDGTRLPLGFMRPFWITQFQLRIDEAAEQIAARSGAHVADRGAVYVGGLLRSAVIGTPAWENKSVTPFTRKTYQLMAGPIFWTFQQAVLVAAAALVLRACSL